MPAKIHRQKARFKSWLIQRFSLRLHMVFVLLCTALSGVLSGQILYALGVRSMSIRYPVSICIAYLVFFVLLRIWLRIILPGHSGSSNSHQPSLDGFFGGGGSSRSGGGTFQGGGGRSGGGGASGSWATENETAAAMMMAPLDSSSSQSKIDMPDLDDDSGGVLVLVAGALLIFAILGSTFYFVYNSPVLLSETAFEFALSAGLIRKSKSVLAGNWHGLAFKKTWIAFAVILVMSVLFGLTVETHFPGVTRLSELTNSL